MRETGHPIFNQTLFCSVSPPNSASLPLYQQQPSLSPAIKTFPRPHFRGGERSLCTLSDPRDHGRRQRQAGPDSGSGAPDPGHGDSVTPQSPGQTRPGATAVPTDTHTRPLRQRRRAGPRAEPEPHSETAALPQPLPRSARGVPGPARPVPLPGPRGPHRTWAGSGRPNWPGYRCPPRPRCAG